MSGHVAPKSLYYTVFLTLMAFTGLTVWVAFYDLGMWSNIVALGIACIKATLVILFFMHVRWSTRLTWVVVMSGFFWLLILFSLGMSDYLSRGWYTSPRGSTTAGVQKTIDQPGTAAPAAPAAAPAAEGH